jgi:hypothetical protein
MLRIFYTEMQVVEAASVEEARKISEDLDLPAGLSLLSEEAVEGSPGWAYGHGDTMEQARADAMHKVPSGAEVVSSRDIETPERRSVIVEAFDWPTANYCARKQVDDMAMSVTDTIISKPGKKGFLGMGRKPNQYEVVLFRRGFVRVDYQVRPKLVRKVGVEIRSSEKLQDCMRGDNLNPQNSFLESKALLKEEGRIGSLGLAKLIDVCRESRSSKIVWPLAAAREAVPTPELLDALRAVLSAKPVDSFGGGAYLVPELIGPQQIGWTDGTYARLMEIAGQSLQSLSRGGMPEFRKKPGTAMIVCSQCLEPAAFVFDYEVLCPRHHMTLIRESKA